jgi:putative ABC transport system substrate-binding protein
MVRSNVDVIVTGINYGIAAAKNATSTIPIVMVYGADPVGAGFVASLSRPGGNITGGAFEAAPEIAGKELQLLRDAAPSVARMALLWNADFPGIAPFANAARDAARALGVEILSAEVRRGTTLNLPSDRCSAHGSRASWSWQTP